MFKATTNEPQLGIFSNPTLLLSGKSERFYEKQASWHNLFRKEVTSRIDESICKALFTKHTGAPNSSIRVLVSMMVLKEANGWSDAQLFEQCRFNLLVRSALGLLNMDDSVPTESTYYLFRKNVNDHAERENENLFDTIFVNITRQQSLEFNVSGKRIRMDSKLMGSNIAWLSRYELIHETIRMYYKQNKGSTYFPKEVEEQLEQVLKIKGDKIVYRSTLEEVKSKLQELGELMYELLSLSPTIRSSSLTLLSTVFDQQFEVSEDNVIVAKPKEEISAKSIQSPHDPDCHFRNKDGNKFKGYSINVTESCDDDSLNLIGCVNVKEVTANDVDFLKDDVEKSAQVFQDKVEDIHADGAYHSPDNQKFCTDKDVNLYLHAIQGAKSRYQLELSENNELIIYDTKAEQNIEWVKITGKNDIEKWRIKTEKGYRYFTQQEIETSKIRKKIEETPVEVLQRRNNVEATIFQLGYHYSNAKSRYRGLAKHQMWANMRCLWVNFVRLLNFKTKTAKKDLISSLFLCFHLLAGLICKFNPLLRMKVR